MFIKIRIAIIVELLSPWAQPELPSNSYTSLEQSYIFRKLPPQKGMSYFIGGIHPYAPPIKLVYILGFSVMQPRLNKLKSQGTNYLEGRSSLLTAPKGIEFC